MSEIQKNYSQLQSTHYQDRYINTIRSILHFLSEEAAWVLREFSSKLATVDDQTYTLDTEKNKTLLLTILAGICQQNPELAQSITGLHRSQLSNQIASLFSNQVAFGPFKGLKLSSDAHWGGQDLGVMILGLYEQEVLNVISSLNPKKRVFIDLGAADGYYGIGVLINNFFEKSYCYEISAKGQEVIKQNSILNNVEDRVTVLGEAFPDFYKGLPKQDIEDCLMLVDIEGGEYGILTELVFEAFKKAYIIVEIHEGMADFDLKLSTLKINSQKSHSLEVLKMGSRDLSGYGFLDKLPDTSRWLLCSEGRGYLMSWFVFSPKTT